MQRALKGCLKNRHIFTQIAQKMAERGYMRTVQQCQTRIKRLKKCFRQNNRWVLNDKVFVAVFLSSFLSFCPIISVCQTTHFSLHGCGKKAIKAKCLLHFPISNTRGNSRLEYKYYEQLERVLGSSASSGVPEVTYDVEEVIDEDESQDGDEDLQFLSHTSRQEIGTMSPFCN